MGALKQIRETHVFEISCGLCRARVGKVDVSSYPREARPPDIQAAVLLVPFSIAFYDEGQNYRGSEMPREIELTADDIEALSQALDVCRAKLEFRE